MKFHYMINPDSYFKASSGWIQKFKKRQSIRLLNINGEKQISNDSAIPHFLEIFSQFMVDNDFVSDQIYNTDESGLVHTFLLYDVISKTGNNINDKLSKINLKDVVFLITESWIEAKDTVIKMDLIF